MNENDRFEVMTRTGASDEDAENRWTEEGQPQTFPSREEAAKAVRQHVCDTATAVACGNAEEEESVENFFIRNIRTGETFEVAPAAGKHKLVLTLTVDYSLNGEEISQLRSRLPRMIERSVGEGLLTGDGPAEVDEYSYRVEVLGDQPSLEQIQKYFQERIDSGNFDVEDTAKLMARYGLMIPELFTEEMAERMAADDAAAPGEAG